MNKESRTRSGEESDKIGERLETPYKRGGQSEKTRMGAVSECSA